MSESTIYTEYEDSRQISEVAASLTRLLRDYDTVAYALGLKQGRTVKNWAENGTMPSDPIMDTRIRVAERLALTVKEDERAWVSGAWLISCNPHLMEHSPAELLRSLDGGETDEHTVAELLFAANDFAANRD